MLVADGSDTPIVIDAKVTRDWTRRREDGAVGDDRHMARQSTVASRSIPVNALREAVIAAHNKAMFNVDRRAREPDDPLLNWSRWARRRIGLPLNRSFR